ncbi:MULTISPECIES: CAP domain-containing protein [unclassified Duganella]|uniref:CAP domain-containing protein n=1 Tax=unclassified Duganella TaxID=2636909 RepID=UPI000E344B54|nr:MULTISPECIES: CAP domain-containing protein [unclassified Duganella]RFP08032.1 CAP domain-containing protein [Duganella sp. BJB475]RFP23809.1 CAP domain-containing protein [Duganella sp. BJB476]
MMTHRRCAPALSALLLALLLSACGGGGGGGASSSDSPSVAPPDLTQAPGAPVFTGNTALDGYNWINYRRAQLGLSTLARNAGIDAAAQGHSNYQRLNNTVSHEQTPGLPGFTGATLLDRLTNAGYQTPLPYAIGEVISATSNPSGFYQAEELITAIYHRFVMFEPVFKEVGTGAATTSANYTYFTADLTAVGGYGAGLGAGRIVNYPAANQSGVPVNFFSDSESPDPVPGRNEVGYPISVHADTIRAGVGVTVQNFTVAPRGGATLDVRLLSHAVDALTPETAAAIVPLAPLKSATVYDVSFSGLVAGVAVTRNWSFTTR